MTSSTDRDAPRAAAAAARALAVYDPLGALQHVALRSDAQALAMRGIAMAQLGELGTARRLLGRAARAFERSDPVAAARCLGAEGEAALAARDLTAAGRALDAAATALAAHGDRINALFVELQRLRRLLLLGDIDKANVTLSSLDVRRAPPRLRAVAALLGGEIAVRTLRAREARAALERARVAANQSGIASLAAEVDRALGDLDAPVGRLVRSGVERPVVLDEVETLVRSGDLIIDACRRQVRASDVVVELVSRPVLLALAVALGTRAPAEATRAELALSAFGSRRVSESVRARLRVEMGRVRSILTRLAHIEPTRGGYALRARRGEGVAVLLPPHPGEESAVLALLRGGESWSTSALAAAVGSSQRAVQRALVALRAEDRVESVGRGRSRRWVARAPKGFATTLLLVSRGAAR
jgi:hypothetical protein